MPVLGSISKKKIVLPSSTKDDEAWVIINPDLLVGEVLGSDTKDNRDRTYEMMTKVILDWNFQTAKGEKAEINVENIKLMKMTDLLAIQTQINIPEETLNELKKKGLSSI